MDADQQAELEATLVLMSRAIRNKLDLVRVKLHLKQWQAFSLAERTQLRDAPCDSPAEIERFATLVDAMVRRYTGGPADRMPHA